MKNCKYTIIAKDIEEDINSNYKDGDLYLSISEIKSKYSVSLDTVNKAFQILEKKGLLSRQHGKGTFVTKDNNLENISILILSKYNLSNVYKWAYLRNMINGIYDYLYDKNIKVSFNSYSFIEKHSEMADEYNGYLLLSPQSRDKQCINLLSKKVKPIISTTNRIYSNIFSVDSNINDATSFILKKLKEMGHKKIGFIADIDNCNNYHDLVRKETYLSYGKTIGLETKEEWCVICDETVVYKNTLKEIKKLNQENGPTAYIISSFEYTVPNFLTDLFKLKHPKCPRLSIIGFDEPYWKLFTDYKISTVEQNFKSIGYKAVQALIKKINNQELLQSAEIVPFEYKEGNTVIKI